MSLFVPRFLWKSLVGGRPRSVTMPCGWGCGKRLTASEIRAHFTSCPKNAWRRDNVLMRARAQAAPPRQPAAVRRTHGPGDLYSRALRVEPAAEAQRRSPPLRRWRAAFKRAPAHGRRAPWAPTAAVPRRRTCRTFRESTQMDTSAPERSASVGSRSFAGEPRRKRSTRYCSSAFAAAASVARRVQACFADVTSERAGTAVRGERGGS